MFFLIVFNHLVIEVARNNMLDSCSLSTELKNSPRFLKIDIQ